MRIQTSVVIPCRNEESTIAKMATMLLRLYPEYINEIIIVNDASTDNTAKIAKVLQKKNKKIRLMNRQPPSGVGLAIRDGLKSVSHRSNYILTLDADFIRNVTDLEEFFREIPKFDGLAGSRYMERHNLIYYPFFKKIFNRIFHFMVKVVFKINKTDLTNNFKLYKKEVFDALPLNANDFAINAEIGLYPVIEGYNIGEIPVIWFSRLRNMGQSKFKLLRVAPGYIRVLINAYTMTKKRN